MHNIESRIMLVTKHLPLVPKGGREMLCNVNYSVLSSIFGRRLVVFELSPSRPSNVFQILNTFRGHIDGLTGQSIANAIDTIRRENVKKVFVDGSNLGALVSAIKNQLNYVEVTVFFHNVESRFFWGSLVSEKTLRALAIFVANSLAERKSVHFSDKRICLSVRDSNLLRRLYGKAASHISPIALEDQFSPTNQNHSSMEPFALFVGGSFYANRNGIIWFVKHVAPYVRIKTYIVGSGMQEIQSQLTTSENVEVIGEVDILGDWYRRALFVIAPIFDGSGMKTKVAEALMFGKKIVGSPEAFVGYENTLPQAGWVCESVEDFIAAIAEAQLNLTDNTFDPTLRQLYKNHFSCAASEMRYSRILCDPQY